MAPRKRLGRGPMEWLLIIGLMTMFIWPFIQLWSIKAIPLFPSDAHRQAAIALENLMAEALARPFVSFDRPRGYSPIPGGGSLGLEGSVEVLPHPDFRGLHVIRARVRWGSLFFRKHLSLEAVLSQDHA